MFLLEKKDYSLALTSEKCFVSIYFDELVGFYLNSYYSSRPHGIVCVCDLYRWFSPDVIAAMLVHRTRQKNVS